jgi:hypothetical protein
VQLKEFSLIAPVIESADVFAALETVIPLAQTRTKHDSLAPRTDMRCGTEIVDGGCRVLSRFIGPHAYRSRHKIPVEDLGSFRVRHHPYQLILGLTAWA